MRYASLLKAVNNGGTWVYFAFNFWNAGMCLYSDVIWAVLVPSLQWYLVPALLCIHGYMGCGKLCSVPSTRSFYQSIQNCCGFARRRFVWSVSRGACFRCLADSKGRCRHGASTGSESSESGRSLGQYLSYEGPRVWRRFTANFHDLQWTK